MVPLDLAVVVAKSEFRSRQAVLLSLERGHREKNRCRGE
jgi:hypothetical protein